jgi:A/G-specific adenine glycosylase
MLQQTQVARVVGYYERWLARWPTPASLAAASLTELLQAWVGLGYNRRALALREACAIVARDGWPEDLQTLPGVGPYTAAAVGAFAFGHHVVALDTNARRLFARLGRPLEPPAGEAATFNQATMELGATICTARRPRCDACPLGARCAGPEAVPAPAGPREKRPRFADTDRWVRGRVIAALAAGTPLPQVEAGRLERAIEGLRRDGLVALDNSAPRLSA